MVDATLLSRSLEVTFFSAAKTTPSLLKIPMQVPAWEMAPWGHVRGVEGPVSRQERPYHGVLNLEESAISGEDGSSCVITASLWSEHSRRWDRRGGRKETLICDEVDLR